MPHFDEALGAFMDGRLGRSDALLLGRKTYEIFVGWWPNRPDTDRWRRS